MWPTFLFAGIAVVFVAMAFAALFHLRWVKRLPSLQELAAMPLPAGSRQSPVRCTVVIAARDEEARIEQTIRHLLAQRGIEIEIIVVDDRSTDQTGAILARLAAWDTRVQIKRVEMLPNGWLGKCHACHVGAAAAKSDWILFTDADCWLKPDVLERALRVAERDGVDHITLTPGTPQTNVGARAWHLLFLTSLVNWFSGVNRDRPGAYLGIGAFNLVRASAYRQCGGYEALRLTVVDDLKLGLLLRRAGKKTRAFLGVDDVECHWGATVRSMVKVMEKNYFAVTEFRVWMVAVGSLVSILAFAVLIAGMVSGTAIGIVAGLSPLLVVVPGAILARRLGWSWPCAALMPSMFPVFLYALLNSTWVTLRQGGVRWRDTFYTLKTLRTGGVR